jgi:hypothetical protein
VLGSAVSQLGGTGGPPVPAALGEPDAPSGRSAPHEIGASASSTSLGLVEPVDGGVVVDADTAPPASAAAPAPASASPPPGGQPTGADGASLSLRAQVGQTAVEVLPAVAVEPRDDFAVELDGEAGGVTISLP